MNKNIAPANTNKYQHHLCEIIIRFLYGENVNVEKYKVYHGSQKEFDRLRGVNITQFDYTTEKQRALGKIEYDDKVTEALEHAKFSKKYGDLHMHDEGDSLFKAVIYSKIDKSSNSDKSILCIYQK